MIRINDEDFKLGSEYYHNEVTKKHQILLMDTHCGGMSHYDNWELKSSKGYKKTTPFTISVDGSIFKHFNPANWVNIFMNGEIDKGIIPISMENEGCLTFSGKKKAFITWSGDIYGRGKDDVHIQKWRGGMFWAPYTTEQIDSLIQLTSILCDEFNIKKKIKDVDYDDVFIENYHGIVTKGDYNILSRDINPSFNRINFKEEIENYEKSY